LESVASHAQRILIGDFGGDPFALDDPLGLPPLGIEARGGDQGIKQHVFTFGTRKWRETGNEI
jgi:hypothetical protein